jgi:hypothetical protein
MKQFILPFFLLIMVFYPVQAQILPWTDDFESYIAGTMPGEPWVLRFSGSVAEISEDVAASGSQSFKMVSLSNWACIAAVPLDTIPDYVLYEGWIYVSQSDRGCAIGFGFTESGNTYRYRNVVSFENNANIAFSGKVLQSYEAQTWYKVLVYCDFVRGMGKAWINDKLMIEEVPLSTPDELLDFTIGGINYSGVGASTNYFDDVKLYLPEFKIKAITDLPNDQGRQVRISWSAHIYDDVPGEGLPLVTSYSLWRKVDPNLGLHKMDVTGDWDYITTVPAVQDWQYQAVVPTLADSNQHGIYTTHYFVRAHTDDPLEHWETAVDSGYSLDNLAPGQVAGVQTQVINYLQIQLSWEESPDKDFAHYNIYRDVSADFIPLIPLATTTEISLTDDLPEPGTYYYKISAVDFNGNEGARSEEVSVIITNVEDAETVVKEFYLKQNYPNPFNPSTLIEYRLPQADQVEIDIYNSLGQHIKRLIDGNQPAGLHHVSWEGTDTAGNPVASGVYIYRIRTSQNEAHRKMLFIR